MGTRTIYPTLYNHPNHPHKLFFNVDRFQCRSTHYSIDIWERECDCCLRDYLLIRSINKEEKIYGMFSCVECDYDLCPECFIREPSGELSLTNFPLELKIDQKDFDQARQYGLEHKDETYCPDEEDPRNQYNRNYNDNDALDDNEEDASQNESREEPQNDSSKEELFDEERRN